ncbi:MAG: LacI family DNA-binding transcriptional regulator [Devosia sp.]|nr:LacI family DNA-binding transcriptional regulator [Devosia sp.]
MSEPPSISDPAGRGTHRPSGEGERPALRQHSDDEGAPGALQSAGKGRPAGRKRQSTIIDVAETAGVAVGTVSRYLNGLKVRRANREQIEHAIEALGYRRNAVAAAMKTDLTHMVGLMVPTFDEFHGVMLEYLAHDIRRTGRALLTYCHGADPRIMQEGLDFFATQRIDALIMTGEEALHDAVAELIENGTPVIFYNNDLRGLSADRVFVDNRGASRRAVSHLLDLGHRRVAIINGSQHDSSGLERFEGYALALADRGIPLDERYIVDGAWTVDGGYHGLTNLMALEAPPTAVFAASYPMGVGALGWIKEHGLKVPDDLSFVSFDDVPLFRLHEAGITAVAQPLAKIADSITSLLVSRLSHAVDERPRTLTLDCDIILRGSTRRLEPPPPG